MENCKRYCLVLLILLGASIGQPGTAFGQGLSSNKPPLLVYPNPQSMLLGGALSVKPKLGLTDNTSGATASVSSVTPQTFTGSVTVNTAGVVTISNPGTIGTFVIAIRAVDSQGAITIARFRLRVRTVECNYYAATPASPYGTEVAANKIGPAVGDFNNDGKIDLVIIEHQAHGITLLLGDGSGNFTAPPNSFTGGIEYLEEAEAADFNRDGNLDLVLRTAFGFAILRGNGQGGFALSTNISSLTHGLTKDLTVGDFNKDGRPDVAYTQSIDSVRKLQIYLNNALLGFVPAPGSPKNLVNDPFEIESRDFNNDGNLDLAVQLSSAVFTFLGDGTGAFPTNLQLQFPVTPGILNAMLAEDFNHDGNDDLALINSPPFADPDQHGVLQIHLGTGTGAFTLGGILPPIEVEPLGLISADINLDGNRDLLSGHVNATSLSLFKNDGYGFFQKIVNSLGPIPWIGGSNPAAEDFNNDGQVDIATMSYGGLGAILLHTTCAPTFTPATIQVGRCEGPTLKTLGTVISDDFSVQQLTFSTPFIPGVPITNLTMSGNNLTAMIDPAPSAALGTYSPFVIVTNPDNKWVGGQVTVNVVDCPPAPLSFIPPANINTNNSPDSCGAIVNYNTPQTTGGTAPVTVACSPASGSSFPLGSTTVSCTATDQAGAQTSTSFQVNVADNQAPQFVGVQNITVNAPAGECSAVVNFQLNATDNCAGVNVVSSPSSGSLFPGGTTVVTATATDASGNVTTTTFNVTVIGSGGLTLSNPVASPNSLWPPNHHMKNVDINYVATPGCGGPVTCTLSVTSNEPVNSGEDGDTGPDWQIINPHRVRLRAERSGAGTGRIYTITVTCTDAAGNQSIKTVTVTVPL